MAVNVYVDRLGGHLDDDDDAHDAEAISFEPAGTVTATNVQDAIIQAAQAATAGIADGSITEAKLAFDVVTPDEIEDLVPDPAPSHYYYPQIAASALWTVNHNLGFYPNVTVVDTAGTVIIGDVEYVNTNTITISFSAPFSGGVYLS